jgi:hypothetical protein
MFLNTSISKEGNDIGGSYIILRASCVLSHSMENSLRDHQIKGQKSKIQKSMNK